MADPVQSKRVRWLALVLLGTLSIVTRGAKADDLVIPLEVAQPNSAATSGAIPRRCAGRPASADGPSAT